MDAFIWAIIGGALVLVALGFFVGHYHAGTQWKALLAQITPAIKADLTTAEAEILATFRKWTKKDPAPPETVAPTPSP